MNMTNGTGSIQTNMKADTYGLFDDGDDDWLDNPNLINKEHIRMDRSENNMGITGVNRETYHSYMVAYIYGKFQFGSLIIKEEFDTNTASAEDIAEFHNKVTSEISAYQGEKITILNMVRFN